ncbi:MAG: glycosyltransferase [Patescibacteria group bacterium]
MNSKPTITIGIPAHNEEATIGIFLDSLLSQKIESGVLERVIVMLDGCIDRTEEKVREVMARDSRVECMSDNERIGKTERLNRLFQINKSNFLATFDADLFLDRDCEIEEMLKEFANDKVVLVSGRILHTRPRGGFVAQVLYMNYVMWHDATDRLNGGDHIHNVYGQANMLRRDFARKVQYPADTTCDEGYLYMISKKYGEFRYAVTTRIFAMPISTIADVTVGIPRFLNERFDLIPFFGETVLDQYYVPFQAKVRAILRLTMRHPIYAMGVIVYNLTTKLLYIKGKGLGSSIWDQVCSTKDPAKMEVQNCVQEESLPREKISVTVGIPAYNEEANIKRLLYNVLNQREIGFSLDAVYVISDGSTDSTVSEVRTVSDPRVRLIINEQRRGQTHAQNMIFALAKSDAVVILEADTNPQGLEYIANLVNPIRKDSNVGLVQGGVQVLPAQTLIGRTYRAQIDTYYSILKKYEGVLEWVSTGRGGRAFSSIVYKTMLWPNAVPEDSYALLWCRDRGIKNVFQGSAVCSYRCSETISDLKVEQVKIRSGRKALERYFDLFSIQKVYDRPFSLRIKMVAALIVQSPFYALSFFIVKSRLYFMSKDGQFSDFWPVAVSTKKH